ncbi:MAG: N-glycosylase/DNA lyase [Sulfolobales archaeon]
MVRVNEERVEQLSRVFAEAGLERIKAFEDLDPQFIAAKMIGGKCGPLTPHIMFTNALISYQLGMPGERYWISFAGLVVNACPTTYEEVVDRVFQTLRYLHRFAVRAKEKRLNKLKTCIDVYDSMLGSDLNMLRRKVAKCLEANIDDKTIVFAIKMLYYGMKALRINVTLPYDIPIPVDRRIIKISYLSGLVDFNEESWKLPQLDEVVSKLFKKPQIVRNAWNAVSLRCGIPPLHLDTVLWLFGKYVDSRSRAEVLERITNEFRGMSTGRIELNYVKSIVDELFYRLPF